MKAFELPEIVQWGIDQSLEENSKEQQNVLAKLPSASVRFVAFSPELEEVVSQNEEISVGKIRKNLLFQASENEKMLETILARIWGNNFPETFITECYEKPSQRAEVENFDEKDEKESENIEDQNIPEEELQNKPISLPNKLNFKKILKSSIREMGENAPKKITKLIREDFISDTFWWIFISEFKDTNTQVLDVVFNRMCEDFVKICLFHGNQLFKYPQEYCELFYKCIIHSFEQAYPESSHLFDANFKEKIQRKIEDWILGISFRDVLTSPPSNDFNFYSKHIREMEERKTKSRKILSLKNSGFITRYLEINSMSHDVKKYHMNYNCLVNTDNIDTKVLDGLLEEVKVNTKQSLSEKEKYKSLKESYKTLMLDISENEKNNMKLISMGHYEDRFG